MLKPSTESALGFAMPEMYGFLLAPLINRSIPDLPAVDTVAADLKCRAECDAEQDHVGD
jgi:hypothetical protein